MSFDPKVYRNSKDGIGMPADSAATDSTQPWTVVSLLKGIWQRLTDGIAVTGAQVDDGPFTIGTDKTQPIAGTYRSTRDAVDDGDAGTVAMNQRRGLYVSVETAASDPMTFGAGAVSAGTPRVTHASDDPLVAATKAEDAASADGHTGFPILAVRRATPANSSGTDGDYEFVQMSAGRLWVSAVLEASSAIIGKVYTAFQSTKLLSNAAVSISASGDNTVVAGTASQTIRCHALVLVAASAVSVIIKDATAGNALTGAIPLAAGGALVLDPRDEPWFVSATAGNFVVNLSAAVSVTGFIQYTKS